MNKRDKQAIWYLFQIVIKVIIMGYYRNTVEEKKEMIDFTTEAMLCNIKDWLEE